MRGFFNLSKIRNDVPRRGLSCPACGLYKSVLSSKMAPYGKFRKKILNVGEAPGEMEDRRGKPWQGRTGQALERAYRRLGIDLFGDCLNINAVNCRPTDRGGSNREPTPKEIDCCRVFRVLSVISKHRPKVIVLLGGAAVSSVIGPRWRKDLGGIFRWRGWRIPDRDYNCWICPTFHPSFVERSDGELLGVRATWERDLAGIVDALQSPLPKFEDESKQVRIVCGEDETVSVLRKLGREAKYLALDIETTGLKPYDRSKHQIACLSLCGRKDESYCLRPPQSRMGKALLKRLLESPDVGKIAQNVKYEHNWLYVLWGIEVQPWVWDTMQAAHLLDNRPGITSLKFQTYVRYGLVDYSSEIDPFLRSTGKSGNSTNRVMELMEEDSPSLMVYCGIDSLVTFRLAFDQMAEMGVKA